MGSIVAARVGVRNLDGFQGSIAASAPKRPLFTMPMVEPRLATRFPLASILLEGEGAGGARVVIVTELESAPRAHLVGRPTHELVVRRSGVSGDRSGVVGVRRRRQRDIATDRATQRR